VDSPDTCGLVTESLCPRHELTARTSLRTFGIKYTVGPTSDQQCHRCHEQLRSCAPVTCRSPACPLDLPGSVGRHGGFDSLAEHVGGLLVPGRPSFMIWVGALAAELDGVTLSGWPLGRVVSQGTLAGRHAACAAGSHGPLLHATWPMHACDLAGAGFGANWAVSRNDGPPAADAG
jgi:hypothetical protein